MAAKATFNFCYFQGKSGGNFCPHNDCLNPQDTADESFPHGAFLKGKRQSTIFLNRGNNTFQEPRFYLCISTRRFRQRLYTSKLEQKHAPTFNGEIFVNIRRDLFQILQDQKSPSDMASKIGLFVV